MKSKNPWIDIATIPAPVNEPVLVSDGTDFWVDVLDRAKGDWQAKWRGSIIGAIGEHPTASSIIWWMPIPALPTN